MKKVLLTLSLATLLATAGMAYLAAPVDAGQPSYTCTLVLPDGSTDTQPNVAPRFRHLLVKRGYVCVRNP